MIWMSEEGKEKEVRVISQVSRNNRGKRKEEGGERHLQTMHQQQQQPIQFGCWRKTRRRRSGLISQVSRNNNRGEREKKKAGKDTYQLCISNNNNRFSLDVEGKEDEKEDRG